MVTRWTLLCYLALAVSCGGEGDEERTERAPVLATELGLSPAGLAQNPTPNAYFSLLFAQTVGGELPHRRLSSDPGSFGATGRGYSAELFLQPSGAYVFILEPTRGSGQFVVSQGTWGYAGWDLQLNGLGIARLTQRTEGDSVLMGVDVIVQRALRGYPLQGERYVLERRRGEWNQERHLARVRDIDPGAMAEL